MLKRIAAASILALTAFTASGDEWRLALPGWNFEFPRDHSPHEQFKTEWWYFTGNVADESGHRFGYQLTFFRQGIRPKATPPAATSRFVIDSLKFAHFALTDVAARQFRFQQKLSRGAFGDAGFGGEKLAWIDDWRLELNASGDFILHGASADAAIDLTLTNAKPWAIHGLDGVSQKAAGEGRASHYYSGTRMKTRGKVTIAGRESSVAGESWFDHEWATNQLTPQQSGWNWFSLQFADGSELMLYQMRLRDGGIDPTSSGTFIDAAGKTTHLTRESYELVPEKFWTSKATSARYPIAWKLRVPTLNLTAEITTPVEAQELALPPIAYWEGLIDVTGQRDDRALKGHGYMELTGYAGALVGLGE